MATEKIILQIQSETNKATAGLTKVEKQIAALESKQKGLTKTNVSATKAFSALGLAVVALTLIYKKAIKDASALEETTNKFKVVFKEVSEEAQGMADNLAESYGLSAEESMRLLSNTGDLLTGFGMTGDQALQLSGKVQTLAADLASFSNIQGGTVQASNALTKALFGEREMLKELGIVIREQDLMQRLAAEGMDKLTGSALLQAKAEMTLKMATEQSKNAIGDFARSQNSYANVTRRVNARLTDMSATIGQELLPAMGNLKIAFLNATKGGGGLMKVFIGLTRFIGNAMNALAFFIETSGEANEKREETIDGEQAYAKMLTNSLKAQNKQIMAMGGLAKVQAQANAGNKESVLILKRQKITVDEITKSLKISGDAISSKKEMFNRYSEENKAQFMEEMAQAEKIAAAQAKGAQGAKGAAEAKKKARQEYLAYVGETQTLAEEKEIEDYELQLGRYGENLLMREEIETEHQERMKEIKNQALKQEIGNFTKGAQTGIKMAQAMQSGVQQITQAHYKKEDKIRQNDYKKKKALIDFFIKDEDQKNKAIQILDFITDQKKKKQMYEQAVINKAMSIVSATINTAVAVTSALGMFPPPLGIAMAAIVGAMGAASIGMIAATPLAEGGIIPGSPEGQLIQAGEKGMTEAVIPLENDDAQESLQGLGGQTIINLNIENLFAEEGVPEKIALEIDEALYNLGQDDNSMFAEALADE